MATQTTSAIALHPTGNAQGRYHFYTLTTGQLSNRNRWTSLPFPGDIFDGVHMLAQRSNASLGLAFTDCTGDSLDNDDDSTWSY
jgi:hypothetical protein